MNFICMLTWKFMDVVKRPMKAWRVHLKWNVLCGEWANWCPNINCLIREFVCLIGENCWIKWTVCAIWHQLNWPWIYRRSFELTRGEIPSKKRRLSQIAGTEWPKAIKRMREMHRLNSSHRSMFIKSKKLPSICMVLLNQLPVRLQFRRNKFCANLFPKYHPP